MQITSAMKTRTAVNLINGKYETEASGGITEETTRRHAECGVDYIWGANPLDFKFRFKFKSNQMSF